MMEQADMRHSKRRAARRKGSTPFGSTGSNHMKALSKILVGEDSYYFKRYHPNMRIYRTILEEHFAPETEE